MFFQNYYISYSNDISINKISSYKKITDKFILKFILEYEGDKRYVGNDNKNKLYEDSLIYSKYYLYWKIYGCVYNCNVMEILYNVEFVNPIQIK